MATHNFRKLDVWQNSIKLVIMTYKLLPAVPDEEKYGLKSQIARCSVSIPSNIAEGSGRTTDKDFSKFLGIALGSSYELETQLILIQELFQIECESVILECQQVQKMIFGFQNKLNNN